MMYPGIPPGKQYNMADDILPLLAYRDGHSSDSDDDVRDDEDSGCDQVPNASDVSYDPSLTAQHVYLGTEFEELSGRTVLEDDSALNLPLLSLPGVVLIPGQTLPLNFFQPGMVSMIRHIIESDRTFGMVTARGYSEVNYMPVLAQIGTTAEIRSYKEETEERAALSTIRVKTEGRQRFQILETRRQADGVLMGKVQVLPEVCPGDSLEGARLPCMQRFAKLPVNMDKLTMQLQYMGDTCVLKVRPTRRKYNRHSCADFTWWPPWVYKQYDEELLMQKIRQELSGWNVALKLETVPRNATEFSFWVAANLPLDDNLRLTLLGINCAIQRLRCELSILERCTVLCCKECNVEITDKKDVFSMSVEGPQGMYVNPGGYVHETLTVHKASSLSLYGRSSTEHSWFPGYAWTIAQCRSCSNHMGWKFTSTDKKLKPEKFWGLCRSSLQPGLKKDETEGDSWVPCL